MYPIYPKSDFGCMCGCTSMCMCLMLTNLIFRELAAVFIYKTNNELAPAGMDIK